MAKREAKPEKRQKPSQRSSQKEKRHFSWRPIVVTVCVIAFALAFLYPVGRDYYRTLRIEQRSQARLDAVTEYNEAVRAENEALQTEEGIENQARADLGWVKEGESSAVVTNGQGSADGTSKLPDHIDVDSITAPHTWYYDILDTIFFVHE